jgi:hypothetical protein
MREPRTLDQRIGRLSPEIDPLIRKELVQIYRVLRELDNPVGVVLQMTRLTLRLFRHIYADAKQPWPSDNLYDVVIRAANGDPEKGIKGYRIIPAPIDSAVHTLRVFSNKADHADDVLRFGAEEAELVLGAFLSLLKWYYCESGLPKRPLASLYAPEQRKRHRWVIPVAVLVLAGALFGVYRSGLLATIPAPVPLPAPVDKGNQASDNSSSQAADGTVTAKLPGTMPADATVTPLQVSLHTAGDRMTWHNAENIQFKITADQACYITLISKDSSGVYTLILPNKFSASNVQLNPPGMDIPPSDGGYVLPCGPPFGPTYVQVIATREPLRLVGVNDQTLAAAGYISGGKEGFVMDMGQAANSGEDLMGTLKRVLKPEDWSEADLTFTIEK